jgi:thiamine-phosphate pyrophosphorylase
MLADGLQYFHLRKPGFTAEDTLQYIEKINREFRKNIVLHQHHTLALDLGLKGIHYNRHHPFNLNDAERYKSIQQSTSCHSLQEVIAASPLLSYVFLSPIFDSISKIGYNSGFDFEDLSAFLKKRTIEQPQVIALGGINENTIPIAKQLGFNGVALMGTIWNDDQSESALLKFNLNRTIIENNVK